MRQKARGDAARRILDPESALSKFTRIFRHNDAHWINALIDCRNFTLRLKAASSQIGTNCTSHSSGVALPLWPSVMLSMRASHQACAWAERFALLFAKHRQEGNWRDRDRTPVRSKVRQE